MNIYDISKKAGVSTATVSRVINGSKQVSEKTRQKVLTIMNEMGYTPNIFARGLMFNSMNTVGVMTIDVDDMYYASSIHTITNELRLKNYDMILLSTGKDIENKKKYMKLLTDKKVDGIILVGSAFKETNDNTHILEAANNIPVVIINGIIEGANVYSIACDESKATYELYAYLSNKGHKTIAYVYDVQTFSAIQKLNGYKSALKKAGTPISDAVIIKTCSGFKGGLEAAEKILELNNNNNYSITAIITSEDILAAGIIKKFEMEKIKVPSQIAVTGFNNSIISICTSPSLTTVDNKVEAMSTMAVNLLLDAIKGKKIPSCTLIEPEIVFRDST